MNITWIEHPSSNYAGRTRENAKADATLLICVDFDSPGSMLTKKSVKEAGKLLLQIDATNWSTSDERVQKIAERMWSKNVKSLNIAGNRGTVFGKHFVSQYELDNFVNVLIFKIHQLYPIAEIRCGGQEGGDIAGARAAIKQGIPLTVLAPKGWKFEDCNGKTISDENKFKERFKLEPVTIKYK
jgi:hypothetical protein